MLLIFFQSFHFLPGFNLVPASISTITGQDLLHATAMHTAL